MSDWNALPSLINDGGVIRKYSKATDGTQLMDKLVGLCRGMIYCEADRLMLVNEAATDRAIQPAIERLQ